MLIRLPTTAVVHLDVTKITTYFDRKFSDRMHLIFVPNTVSSATSKSEDRSAITRGGRAFDNLPTQHFESQGLTPRTCSQ